MSNQILNVDQKSWRSHIKFQVKAKEPKLSVERIMDATRKRKNKTMAEKLYAEILDASQNKGSAIKEDTHKWQSRIKLCTF